MNVLRNPYIAGNPVGATKNFVGREALLEHLYRVLAATDSNAIVLYGQRRIGKTSILLQLLHELPQEGAYIPVYFDLQDRAALSLTDILNELAFDIANVLNLDKSIDPSLTPDRFKSQFLPQVLEVLRLGEGQGRSLVLLFDEFDVLAQPSPEMAGVTFFPYLRGLRNHFGQRVQLVFAIGRQFDNLPSQGKSAFKGLQKAHVSLFTEADTYRLVGLSQQDNSRLRWHETALQRIWDLTEGHPYLTQQLCSVIWDEGDWNSDLHRQILPQIIERAISKTLERSVSGLQWIWDGLSPVERVIASAIAETGAGIISPEELDRTLSDNGVRLQSPLLSHGLRQLEEQDFLKGTDEGFRFQVDLFRQWVGRSKPLLQTKVELDRIQPEAERLFKEGADYYQYNQLDQAATQLTSALQINANHLRARLLLGRIRLEQGHIAQAVAEFARAYDYDDVETRPDYVKALLALVDSQSQLPFAQYQTCQRLLKVEPTQRLALKRRTKLAIKLGDEALAQNDLQKALNYYQEAQLEKRMQEVKRRLRKEQLEPQLQQAEHYEAAENWQAALQLYEQLREQFPEEKEWTRRLQRAQQQLKLASLYRQAQQALSDGDSHKAVQLLSQILSMQPAHKPAQELMSQALEEADIGLIPKLSLSNIIRWGGGILFTVALMTGIWFIMSGGFTVPPQTPTPTVTSTSSTSTATSTGVPPPTPTLPVTSTLKPSFTVTAQADTMTPEPALETSLPSNSGPISESPDKVVVLERLRKHTDRVWSLDFSPDGDLLASGAHDNQIRLWDVDKGSSQNILTDTAKVWSIDFSPDGTFLASGSEDGTIRLWDVVRGEAVQSFTGHSAAVRSVAFHPDGSRLLSGADDNTVRLWDLATGERLQSFTEPADWVLTVAISPDGTQIASGDADKTIYLWQLNSEQGPQRLTGHTDWVRSIAFSPDGKRLASASYDNTVRLWNLAEGEVQAVLEGHAKSVNSVAFSPDGRHLLSGADDKTIRLWDVEREMLIQTWPDKRGRVWSVAFNSDGTRLASGSESGSIHLWGVATE